ncbi:MAG: hypothetical protein E6G40_06645 [Actinobacteria bacterium]|nr:MAG: hypothetical protein E6G44_00660 [Actinomycetota bacterium]TMK99383.1 MAG: hypothetical protein E6G40_06645 [Actinomycetota bacterium]
MRGVRLRVGFLTLLAIVLVGWMARPAVAAAGDLDPTFGDNGKVTTGQIGVDILKGIADIALQPDGKIVAVGTATSPQGDEWYFALVRYKTDGRVDGSFGQGGGVVTDIGEHAFGHAVAIQTDGKIVAGGHAPCPPYGIDCMTLVRYNVDGSVDKTFGTAGIARAKLGFCGCEVNDLAIQPDGKIVAAGWRFKGDDANNDDWFAVARFNSDGSLDQTFGTKGKLALSFGYGDDFAWGVALQPDGKIVVAGEGAKNFYATGSDIAVARLNTDGSLDPTFWRKGMRTVNISGDRWDGAYGVAIQADGKIVAAGFSYADFAASDPQFVATRLNPDGSLDAGFGHRGRVVTAVGGFGGYAGAVAVYPGGKILAAGRSFVDDTQDSSDFVLVRYTSDGRPDPTFGGDGTVITSFGTGADVANALAVQADGKMLAAGEVYARFGLARYLGDI